MKVLTPKLFVASTVVWTLILAISLVWNLVSGKQQIMDEAYAEARANLNKDISLRRWATSHGGVYVPITEKQKPVPWLSHIPNRDIISTDGRQLTLLNPATILRQTMDRYAEEYGVRGRIIGLKQLNPDNAPDEWERAQLIEFTQKRKEDVWAISEIDGVLHLRYLRAMIMEPGCDKCHAILGYKTGDVRGATGINLSLQSHLEDIRTLTLNIALTHGSIWILGFLLILMGWRSAYKQEAITREAENILKISSAKYKAVINTAKDAILTVDDKGHIVGWNKSAESLFGYTEEEILDQSVDILMPSKFREHHNKGIKRVVHGGENHLIGRTVELVGLRKDSSEFPMELSLAKWDANGDLFFSGIIRDITTSNAHKNQLEMIAHYDTLTKLPNRVLFADRLKQSMTQSKRRGMKIAVAYLDIDGFKPINDTYGHNFGDRFLIELSERMKSVLRDGDTLARIGGDEFIAVMVDIDGSQDSRPLLDRLLLAASTQVTIDDIIMRVTVSIGVTFYPQEGADADLLIRQADQAMYSAKQAGKNRYHYFDVKHDAELKVKYESQERISRAIKQNEFVLYYQPKVNMKEGNVIGAEALIRWQHPERGLLPPAEFLPLIENHRVSVELGEWVMNSALKQIQDWLEQGLDIPVSINISAEQFQSGDFEASLRDIFKNFPDVPPKYLELEVLETSALEDVSQVSRIMRSCNALGVQFSLDDFGTGYSSLTYLKRLPVNVLKIDQSFVRDMLIDQDDLAIVQGVIGLANAFSIEVIAEGVETVDHGTILLQMGCLLAQGYGIARPMPASEMPEWLKNWKPDKAWMSA